MILSDFHTHTTFSDGDNTPEEMVLAAIGKGMTAIGFSDHSYTFFDESYCLLLAKYGDYQREIHRLSEKYRGKIQIFCGIEQDFYSVAPVEGFDYVIGSVHYLRVGNEYIPVDETPEILVEAAEKHFGGDMLSLAECYFATVAELKNMDLIGHFDLIRKFNRDGRLFSESDPRYIAAAQQAADALLQTGKPFEVNTGAVCKGYLDTPYPSREILSYIASRGGKFVLSSDCHRISSLMYGFSGISQPVIEFMA